MHRQGGGGGGGDGGEQGRSGRGVSSINDDIYLALASSTQMDCWSEGYVTSS